MEFILVKFTYNITILARNQNTEISEILDAGMSRSSGRKKVHGLDICPSLIPSEFWRLHAQDQAPGWMVSWEASVLGVYRHLFSLCPHRVLTVCLCPNLFLEVHGSDWIRAHPSDLTLLCQLFHRQRSSRLGLDRVNCWHKQLSSEQCSLFYTQS